MRTPQHIVDRLRAAVVPDSEIAKLCGRAAPDTCPACGRLGVSAAERQQGRCSACLALTDEQQAAARDANAPALAAATERAERHQRRVAAAPSGDDGDDTALWLWALHEALPGMDLPADAADAAGRAIEARAAKDSKGAICRDDNNHTLLRPRQMADALADLAESDGWRGLDTLTRCLVDTLLETAHVWPRLRMVTIGQANRNGGWRDPTVPARGADDSEPQTLADVSADPAVPVAAGLLFRGRLGLLHGPSFGGKSTLLGNVLARIVTGRPWLDRPTIGGDVIAVVEEAATYAHIVRQAGGDLSRVRLRRWRELPRAAADIKPAAIIVDTMQRIAHEIGGLNLNQPDDADRILRVLESIARDNDCAVLVTDHEPYEEGKSGTKDRPRGSTAKPATVDYVLRCLRDDTVTTVTPGRGMARFGIDVFTFAVDVRGEPVTVAAAAAPPAAKPPARLDPDGYLWLDPEIDDPMRAWFVANVTDGAPPSWRQCLKRIRKEAQISAGNDRLKASYGRVAAWFAGGDPQPCTPTPADHQDHPIRESADHPDPVERITPDHPIRSDPGSPDPGDPQTIGGSPPGSVIRGSGTADRSRPDPDAASGDPAPAKNEPPPPAAKVAGPVWPCRSCGAATVTDCPRPARKCPRRNKSRPAVAPNPPPGDPAAPLGEKWPDTPDELKRQMAAGILRDVPADDFLQPWRDKAAYYRGRLASKAKRRQTESEVAAHLEIGEP